MRRALLAAALPLLLVVPALAQGIKATVTPTDAAFGQSIRVNLYNGTSQPIYYGSTFAVADGGGRIIFSPPGGPPGQTLAPGKRLYMNWNQEDNFAKQVAPGYYTVIYHYGTNQYAMMTLRQSVIIRDAKISWSGLQKRGRTLYFNLDAPQAKGLTYRTVLSFSDAWGVDLPGGRRLQLVPDALFFVSAANGTTILKRFAGTVDSQGKAASWIDIPRNPLLRGLKFHAAFVMFSQYSPGGIHSVTRSLDLTIL